MPILLRKIAAVLRRSKRGEDEKPQINEVLKPSETQQEMVSSFADRAEQVRNGNVDPRTDNMLKITNDGRKLALDQRLINDLLPDEPESKVNLCVENAYQVWEESTPDKSTQLMKQLRTIMTGCTLAMMQSIRWCGSTAWSVWATSWRTLCIIKVTMAAFLIAIRNGQSRLAPRSIMQTA